VPLRYWFFTLVIGFSFTVVNAFFICMLLACFCRFSWAVAVIVNSNVAMIVIFLIVV